MRIKAEHLEVHGKRHERAIRLIDDSGQYAGIGEANNVEEANLICDALNQYVKIAPRRFQEWFH